MEIDNCQKYVLAELEDKKAEVERLERLKDIYLQDWLAERDKSEKLQAELERAADQMAELEMQLERVCRQYNELVAKTGTVIHDFEPVREVEDGD